MLTGSTSSSSTRTVSSSLRRGSGSGAKRMRRWEGGPREPERLGVRMLVREEVEEADDEEGEGVMGKAMAGGGERRMLCLAVSVAVAMIRAIAVTA